MELLPSFIKNGTWVKQLKFLNNTCLSHITMSEILHNSKKINTNSGAWNIAVLISVVFLIYLPSKEALSTSEQSGGYLELLPLLPAGIFYTLLVTFLGSAAAILVGVFVGLGKLSKNPAIRLPVSFYTEILRGVPLLVLLFYIYSRIFHRGFNLP